MCGRYLFDSDFEELYRKYILYEAEGRELPYGEMRPTNSAPIIINRGEKKQLVMMKWGLEGYQKSQRLINARSETILDKKRFSKLMNSHRCIVPARAFYEWQKEGTPKVKYTFSGSGILSFAGLYEPTSEGDLFTIITMASEGEISRIHDRMPIALSDEDINCWIRSDISSGEAYKKLLQQHPKYIGARDCEAPVQLSFL